MIKTLLYVVIIPIAVIAIGTVVSRRYKMHSNHLFLVAAALLFSISIFLPSPIIYGTDSEFWTHFFGGGFFIGLLCLYFRPLLRRRLVWWQELLLLFVIVSTFGVVNELYEAFAYVTGLSHEALDDTSWDLVANTLGSIAFFVLYKGITLFKTLFISR